MSESAALLAALDEKIAAAEETLRTLRDARTTLLRQIENDRLDAHLDLLPAEVLTATLLSLACARGYAHRHFCTLHAVRRWLL